MIFSSQQKKNNEETKTYSILNTHYCMEIYNIKIKVLPYYGVNIKMKTKH